tara:strand:+ start:7365 stop:7670 length:306 start_codon:yes stop_codon:yes gene_type:complete
MYASSQRSEFDYEDLMRKDVPRTYMSVGYVLVNVEPGSEVDVFNTASTLSFVSDANLLFGDHDLIVKLEAENMGEIARLVVESIRAIPGVLNTKTLACAEM